MLKYEYENATVYITKPTEKHIENIKKATEKFMRRVIKEELRNENKRYYSRISRGNFNAGRGTK